MKYGVALSRYDFYPHVPGSGSVEFYEVYALPPAQSEPAGFHKNKLTGPHERTLDVSRRIALAMTKIGALGRYAIQRQSHIVLYVRIPILIDGQACRRMGTKNVAHTVRDTTISNHGLQLRCDVVKPLPVLGANLNLIHHGPSAHLTLP
jgi:hypothetical protein